MKKNKPVSRLLFAESLADEISADWRYGLVLPYVQHSPSYLAVKDMSSDKKAAAKELPRDHQAVRNFAQWLGILSIDTSSKVVDPTKWLKNAKANLYGFQKPIPSVAHTFTAENEPSHLISEDLDYPCIMLRVPLTLTMSEAVKQIKAIFNLHISENGLQFNSPLPKGYNGEYKLEISKLRRSTLVKGVDALAMYKSKLPLWEIGNELKLSPRNQIDVHRITSMDQDELADKKRVLSIMAKRLINTAFLIAENAARGRFPSDKPFPEAILDTYKRTAGRPAGSKRTKRLNVR